MTEYIAVENALENTPTFANELLLAKRRWYQYRNFDGFWSIIQSDSFWATDARFSNDNAEQRFATDIVQHKLKKGSLPAELNEDYIVCFCGEDDKLSQWRGYASSGGVSIGFEFNAAVPFYVPLGENSLEYDMKPDTYKLLFVQLGKVCYIPSPDGVANDAYYQKCYETMSLTAAMDSIADPPSPDFVNTVKKCATFVKHAGFIEEDEWRIVFHNEERNLSQCVHYKNNKNGIRQPYIIVRPGNPDYNTRACVVRLCLFSISKKLNQKLQKTLKGIIPDVEIDTCYYEGAQDKSDSFCFGCTRRCWVNYNTVNKRCRYALPDNSAYEWGIYEEENCVIVSQGNNQEKVFNEVHSALEDFCKENDVTPIPVWCEGHLPIRSITVGPCIRQDEVAESIRHYCKHTYWLRDVDIRLSTIPFRQES